MDMKSLFLKTFTLSDKVVLGVTLALEIYAGYEKTPQACEYRWDPTPRETLSGLNYNLVGST